MSAKPYNQRLYVSVKLWRDFVSVIVKLCMWSLCEFKAVYAEVM